MTAILELKRASKKAARDINHLLPQLSLTAKPLSLGVLKKIIQDKNNHLVVAKDGQRIIGMGSLLCFYTPVGFHARIESVVIDHKYRGQGLGKRLTEKLIFTARKRKAKSIELSSRPGRIEANKLYQALGFKKRETNVYVLTL